MIHIAYPTDLSPESCAIRDRIHADALTYGAHMDEVRRQRAAAIAAVTERRRARGEVIHPEGETRWEVPPRSLTAAQRRSLRYETSPTRDEQAAENHATIGHMPRMRLTDVWHEDRDPPGSIRVCLVTWPPCAKWSRELLIAANGETEHIS